jgi:transposase
MSSALLSMSLKELDRVDLMRRIHERRLTQAKAAEILGVGLRQVERLYRTYKRQGPVGLASGKRGRPSNRKLPGELREHALELVRTHYADFGPTLALEKLQQHHGVTVSVETLRKWMVADGLWTPRAERRGRVQQPRRRRDCLGELVQIDGSDHEWFEARAPRCVLLVFVDDATGRLMELQFCMAESTFAYFNSTQRYLQQHGKPVAFYSDKANIFRVNKREPKGGDGLTQFGRAMTALNIDIICANTPAAKGRVERAHLTLQDRLVKELRLAGVSDVAAANRFLPGFTDEYNQRFGRPPRNPYNAHRPLLPGERLDDIFTWQEQRRVSKSLTVNYHRIMYLLEESDEARKVRGKRVTVHETEDGDISIRNGPIELPATAFPMEQACVSQGAIVSNKLLAGALTEIKQRQEVQAQQRLAGRMTLRDKAILRRQVPSP